ncbi:MAG: short-chain oxidoreductase, partial [Pseudobdellovibrionaceae bacterium]
MKIEEVLNGIDSFIYMERYVNEHTKSYSPFASLSEVQYQYQPSSDFEFFDLVSVTVPLSKASIFHANPSKELFDFYVRDENIRFMIHPEIWSCDEKIAKLDELRSLNKMESLRVSPTASTRTVLTRDTKDFCPPHFVKLHYPRRISRFNRRLRYKIIRNSIGVTKDLEQINFEKFAYLPDCLGFTFGKEKNSWGFLVREFQPRPYLQNRFLIPFFSLYG